MTNSPNKCEDRGRKKLLRTQVYNLSKELGKALQRYDKEKSTWEKNEIQKSKKDIVMDNERKSIMDILGEKSDFFVKRAIVWDIISYSRKIWWQERQIIQFKCKYGLWITIDNLYSFLAFCAVHWFIPMIDKIYIEWEDISKKKKVYTFFAPILSQSSNQLTINSLKNEIKEKGMSQWYIKEILYYIEDIMDYTTKTYQRLLWENLWKIKNIWAKSENIFAEIAIRLENQIREKIWIESSYLNMANYKDDVDKKTDFKLLLRKTPYQSYQDIPTQFTVGSAKGGDKETKIKKDIIFTVGSEKGGDKEIKIEEHLIEEINKWDIEHNNFLLFFVNWEFWKRISHTGKKDEESLNLKYIDWVNNPREREKIVWSKFPLFIDTIDPKEIQPAEIMYIAFHMLYKKFNFKFSLEETYLNNIKNKIIGAINWKNRWEINWIKLSDIGIKDCSIEKIKNPRPNYPCILKHRFSISYQWEPMWVIVIYEIEPKRRDLLS